MEHQVHEQIVCEYQQPIDGKWPQENVDSTRKQDDDSSQDDK